MNEEQTLNRLLNGLYHRPYGTTLTKKQVEDLAEQHGIKVSVIEYHNELIKAVFEVKP